ncbi:orotidine-5'-phosphate decarboxylase [Allohahella marinimesophila]|uniref:Orotidine 5'-phosphate decarboxylase n=1 Tax=Allohahella marinimesophila TaxID=1054972 RepID=A0ABP7P325_9GAMM
MSLAPSSTEPRIIVALDTPHRDLVTSLIQHLDPSLCRLKIGKELFTACGPALIGQLRQRGFDIFLDLKFHDIPNTCAAAVREAARLGVWMVNVHASGGSEMMRASREALAEFENPPLLIAVTVLTSFSEEAFGELGFGPSIADVTKRLAGLAMAAELDGVVCSVHEVAGLKAAYGDSCLTITPGIRPVAAPDQPVQSKPDDQKRVASPEEARAAGSDYLVIGRPITQARDPGAVLRAIHASLPAAK